MNLFFYYLIVINVITFIMFAYDKMQAKGGGWRVAENLLWLLALLGGALGGFSAMELMRHKRQKPGFVLVMLLILLAQIAAAVYLIRWTDFFS